MEYRNIGREIRRRERLYDHIKARGMRSMGRGEWDDALGWFTAAGRVAWEHFFGLWTDTEIEDALLRITDEIGRDWPPFDRRAGTVAHLATYVTGGGHTAVLRSWHGIIETWGREQLVLCSDPRSSPVENVASLVCPATRPVERARWVYERAAGFGAETLILYTHPDDAAGLCAAAALRRAGVRVVFAVHADHVYSLGARLADRVVEYRPLGASHTAHWRGVDPSLITYVPLCPAPRNSPPVARAELGLPAGATVSITVSTYYKLAAVGGMNYGRTINELLRAEPEHYHVIVGHGPQRLRKEVEAEFDPEARRRVVWTRKRMDVDALLRLADFALDSLPLMGGLACFDAMAAARPVVAFRSRQFGDLQRIGAFDDSYPFVARTGDETVELSRRLIASPELRRETGEGLRRRYDERFAPPVVAHVLARALSDDPPQVRIGPPSPYDADFLAAIHPPVRSRWMLLHIAEVASGYSPRAGAYDNFLKRCSYGWEAVKLRAGRIGGRLRGES
ncbi:MAG: glycosyltransferase [Acidobacteria bacterium]|nr:glycosyltransferase [Acidobacteriota bacterium]